jgi:rhodanese-related sulfurtransferase
MQHLAAADALRLLQSAAEPRPQLLDVREPWELALVRVTQDGATLHSIPLGQLPQRWTELDASRPVLCLCHHGVRSQHAAMFLEHQGLTAINVSGGIDAWATQVDPALPRY